MQRSPLTRIAAHARGLGSQLLDGTLPLEWAHTRLAVWFFSILPIEWLL